MWEVSQVGEEDEQPAVELVEVEEEQPAELPAEPGKFGRLLRSRKFWALVAALALVIIKAYAPDFPVSEDQLISAVAALAAYTLGVALEDGLQAVGGARNG